MIRFGRRVGGIDARLVNEGVVTLPDLHGKTTRVGVAHGHTPQVVSGPDCEHRRDRHSGHAAGRREHAHDEEPSDSSREHDGRFGSQAITLKVSLSDHGLTRAGTNDLYGDVPIVGEVRRAA